MYDPRIADANYRSFPPFEAWMGAEIDSVRWDRYTAILTARGSTSPEQLAQARNVVKRAAAVDTGAIEGLYEADRGFTFTVATQAAIWEAALDARGPHVRALIESQLKAYDYVLDVATQSKPISEVWIRTLHEELCAHQETHNVVTEIGPQSQPLPRGEYKHLPNHVLLPSGDVHSYAPVDLVTAEMQRLCEILRSEQFLDAHPVIQAAFAHYSFVAIHPFADGNGRVARALASIYTYRSHSIPLLILVENRKSYLDSLAAADRGDYQAFVDFVMERTLDSVLIVNESLSAALAPQPLDALGQLTALFTTKGGYTQEEVNKAGERLLIHTLSEIEKQTKELPITHPDRLQTYFHRYDHNYEVPVPNSRVPKFREGNHIDLRFQTGQPLSQNLHVQLGIAVPTDAGREDDIYLVDIQTQWRVFSARVSELTPDATVALQMRISIAVQRIIGEALAALVAKVKSASG